MSRKEALETAIDKILDLVREAPHMKEEEYSRLRGQIAQLILDCILDQVN